MVNHCCYGHGGGHETIVLYKRYSSCMKRTLIIELLTFVLISNVLVWLGMCTITEEFTFRVVFLGVYIFVRLDMSLLKVCCLQWHTFVSNTLSLHICHFPECVICSDILLPVIYISCMYITSLIISFAAIYFHQRHTFLTCVSLPWVCYSQRYTFASDTLTRGSLMWLILVVPTRLCVICLCTYLAPSHTL